MADSDTCAPDDAGGEVDAIESLRRTINFDPRDWGAGKRDAWLYGVIVGWGDALPQVAARHGWDEQVCARLEHLRASVAGSRPALTPQAREVDALSQHPVAVLSRYAGHLEDCASHADAEEIACSCGYVDAWNAVFSRSAFTPRAGEMGAVGDLLALGAATVFGRPGHP